MTTIFCDRSDLKEKQKVGGTLSHDSVIETIIKGAIDTRKVRGRTRLEYTIQVKEDVHHRRSYWKIRTLVQGRSKWRTVANQSLDS